MNVRLLLFVVTVSVLCGCSSHQVTPAQIRSKILDDRSLALRVGEYLITTPLIPSVDGKKNPDGTLVCYGYRLQALSSDRARFTVYSPCRRVFAVVRTGVLKIETIEEQELGSAGQSSGAVDSKMIITQDENLIAAIKRGDARGLAGYRAFYLKWRLENQAIAGFIENSDENFARWLGLR
jgi:hypothetical protein